MPWQKGQSGNPRGRPSPEILKTALIKLLREKSEDGVKNYDRLVWKLLQLGLAGNLDAIKYMFDRVDGPLPPAAFEPIDALEAAPADRRIEIVYRHPDEGSARFPVFTQPALGASAGQNRGEAV